VIVDASASTPERGGLTVEPIDVEVSRPAHAAAVIDRAELVHTAGPVGAASDPRSRLDASIGATSDRGSCLLGLLTCRLAADDSLATIGRRPHAPTAIAMRSDERVHRVGDGWWVVPRRLVAAETGARVGFDSSRRGSFWSRRVP
jgi:hypothetical protein